MCTAVRQGERASDRGHGKKVSAIGFGAQVGVVRFSLPEDY